MSRLRNKIRAFCAFIWFALVSYINRARKWLKTKINKE